MIVLCRMATAVADWAHARAAREYARTLLTGPHCCATTSFDYASPTSHRAQRECPATQIARHGCRQHAWAVRAHRDTVILTTTQHFFPRSPIPREMCPTWATRNATWHESCARAVHSGGSAMASMVMARPSRQQWRRTVAPSELGRADRAPRALGPKIPSGIYIRLGVKRTCGRRGLKWPKSPGPLDVPVDTSFLRWNHLR